MSKYLIRLEMAENYEFPSGDSECGYEFFAPLNEDGLLDAVEWKENSDNYTVQRFWRNETKLNGRLVFLGEKSWHFHYGGDLETDEPTYRFGCEKFVVGEFVNLRDHAAEMRIFRIAKVEAVTLVIRSD